MAVIEPGISEVFTIILAMKGKAGQLIHLDP
jgi:hypothetical protein